MDKFKSLNLNFNLSLLVGPLTLPNLLTLKMIVSKILPCSCKPSITTSTRSNNPLTKTYPTCWEAMFICWSSSPSTCFFLAL